jgi:RimJ/RimL family protein N-acetyltransferase
MIHLAGNTDKVEFFMAVPPEHRRRGAGRALVEYAVRRAEEAGGTYALTMSSYPLEERETHGYLRFAEAVGFAVDLEEIHRMLPLPVDEDLLQKLAADAASHHAGYRIETWIDEVPEPYVDSWLQVHNQIALDAPQGVVPWEEDAMDRTALAEQLDVFGKTGRTFLSAVAISPDDEVVAYSDLVLRGGGSTKVSQWGTLVRRDHRGHRLGTSVKVANLVRLQADHPECTEVHTTNAEVNDAMIGINETLGYRAVAVHPDFYRKIR